MGLALVMLLVLLLFWAVTLLEELYCSKKKKNFERERAEKTAELRNENTELRAALEKVIKVKGKNHIETAKIFREIGRNLKRSGIYQETERCRIYQEAEEAHREALGIYQQILGPKSHEVARTCRHIAELVSGPERGQEKNDYLWRAFLIEKRWVKMTLSGEDMAG